MVLTERDVEKFALLGMELDAKRRKDRITYSERNRNLLAEKESVILEGLVVLLATAGGAATAYGIFLKRPELSKALIEITKALGKKNKHLMQLLASMLKQRTRKQPTFFRYIAATMKDRSVYALRSYGKSAKVFFGRGK